MNHGLKADALAPAVLTVDVKLVFTDRYLAAVTYCLYSFLWIRSALFGPISEERRKFIKNEFVA